MDIDGSAPLVRTINFRPASRCPHHDNCYIHFVHEGFAPIHLHFVEENSLTRWLDVLTTLGVDQDRIEVDTIPRSSDTSSMCFWKNGVKHIPVLSPIPPTAVAGIPFAPVTRPDFDWSSFEAWFDVISPHPDLLKMNKWLSSNHALADHLHQLLAGKSGFSQPTNSNLVSLVELSSVFIDQGTVVFNNNGFNSLSAPLFKVPKSGGNECRAVWDGRMFDILVKEYLDNLRVRDKQNGMEQHPSHYNIPSTPLPAIPLLVNEILDPKWTHMSTIDARNMFYQFKIRSGRLRQLFGILLRDSITNKNIHLLLVLPAARHLFLSYICSTHLALHLSLGETHR